MLTSTKFVEIYQEIITQKVKPLSTRCDGKPCALIVSYVAKPLRFNAFAGDISYAYKATQEVATVM